MSTSAPSPNIYSSTSFLPPKRQPTLLIRGSLEYSHYRRFITGPARLCNPKAKTRIERSIQFAMDRCYRGGYFKVLGPPPI